MKNDFHISCGLLRKSRNEREKYDAHGHMTHMDNEVGFFQNWEIYVDDCLKKNISTHECEHFLTRRWWQLIRFKVGRKQNETDAWFD